MSLDCIANQANCVFSRPFFTQQTVFIYCFFMRIFLIKIQLYILMSIDISCINIVDSHYYLLVVQSLSRVFFHCSHDFEANAITKNTHTHIYLVCRTIYMSISIEPVTHINFELQMRTIQYLSIIFSITIAHNNIQLWLWINLFFLFMSKQNSEYFLKYCIVVFA